MSDIVTPIIGESKILLTVEQSFDGKLSLKCVLSKPDTLWLLEKLKLSLLAEDK